MSSKERTLNPAEVESLKGRQNNSYSTLRDNYEETIEILQEYKKTENPPSVASASKIVDRTDTDYSAKELGQRLYPLAEISVIDTWGGDASSVSWDLTGLTQHYLEEAKNELGSILEQ
jgi:hypothetical protein